MVNGSVSAGVSNMSAEGSSMFEEVGIGLGVAIKVFNMGENTA